MMEYYVRRLVPEDLNIFLEFLANWIKHIPISRHYQWLYQQNPHGMALTWIAIHKETKKIIGCTSIFPRKIWFRNQIILGCTGGDTYVDPKFRRKGIATKLHSVTLREMTENGIKFQHGFPVVANLYAFRKMGSYYPGNFKQIRLLLRAEFVTEKFNLGKRLPSVVIKLTNKVFNSYIKSKTSKMKLNNYKLKKISNFDDRFDKLVQEINPYFNICCVRDSDYLNWRYFKNPMRAQTIFSYEDRDNLYGFAAVEFSGNKCILFDFVVTNEDDLAQNFICSLIELAISKQSFLISSIINPDGPYIDKFLRCGFKLGYHSAKIPLMVLIKNDDRDLDYVEKLENWYLTYGDTDYGSIDN